MAAADVLIFVREAIQKFNLLRPVIIEKLLEAFPTIKTVRIHRAALWILGEYANTSSDILEVFQVVNQTLGEVPIVEAEQKRLDGDDSEEQKNLVNSVHVPNNKVTSDGTYATQSAYSVAPYVIRSVQFS